jgi:hypothetical protein
MTVESAGALSANHSYFACAVEGLSFLDPAFEDAGGPSGA